MIGVGIGAIIHNWIPQSVIETVLGSNNPLGAFIAICASGIIIVGYFFNAIQWFII